MSREGVPDVEVKGARKVLETVNMLLHDITSRCELLGNKYFDEPRKEAEITHNVQLEYMQEQRERLKAIRFVLFKQFPELAQEDKPS